MKIKLKTLHTFGLLFAIIGNAQATEITKTSATGTKFQFTATLDAPLMTGNKVKIDFGKGGLKAMTCSAKTCTLSSNVLPTGISTATYKIGIYDAKNVLQGSTSDGTYVISSNSNATASTSTTDSITTDYSKTTGYTKIANNGSMLPDSAKLGANPTDWACTKDNKTGLMWEIKTTDGGLRDMNNGYSWYKPKGENQGKAGYQNGDGHPEWCKGSDCDTYAFTNAVNEQGLCGAKDWRMPTKKELVDGLVLCSDGKVEPYYDWDACKGSPTTPTINTTYFPNTPSDWFWSSSPGNYTKGAAAMAVYFNDGSSNDGIFKNTINNVRLVRFEEKPVVVIPPPVVELKPAIYTKIANDGSELPDSATLGSNSKDWACTRDNETGLIWEVKTSDGGSRNLSKSYTLEQSSDFVVSVNTQKICGATDWRLPTKDELKTLVYCSVGSFGSLGKDSKGSICWSRSESPTINRTYFPNTQKNWFWSDSIESGTDYYGQKRTNWVVNFSDGNNDSSSVYDVNYVRLVR